MSLRLKLLRMNAGLTLESLAQATQLTRSYISKLERGKSSPSVGTALRLAKALGVPVEQLFGEASATETVAITRAEHPVVLAQSHASARVVAASRAGGKLMAFVLSPGTEDQADQGHPMSQHDGEEVLFVLRGQLRLQFGDRFEILGPGDCAHFNSLLPHRITSEGEAGAEVLLVVTTPP